MGLLENKVAVITGAGRGLGLAIAQAYAREGAAVILAARTAGAIEKAVDDLTEQGFQAAGMACDVTDAQQVEQLACMAEDRFGHIDIWINNAARTAEYGPTDRVRPDAFIAATQTNILGTYHGSMAALRRFLPQRSGKLLNLLGAGSDRPAPNQNAYGSSKAWIRWFSTALAREIAGQGVEVLLFNPGLVLTDLLTHVDVVKGYGKKVKPLATIMRMWANPPEVPATKAVWLASHATDSKNGLHVRVLTPTRMLGGAAKELLRFILARKIPPSPLVVKEVD
jgi:NAD(P)-dependent dehydrogenase (short-subunit alcohol dehydrogenase family)